MSTLEDVEFWYKEVGQAGIRTVFTLPGSSDIIPVKIDRELCREGIKMPIYLSLIESDSERSKFEIIYTAYKNLMLYHANRILGDQKDSEDVVHESFLKIINILEKIDEPKCPKTRCLVVTIVERTAIDLYRHRQRNRSVVWDEEYVNMPSMSQMDAIHGKIDFAAAIAALPTKYRELLLLRYDSGFSENEVAMLMNMSQENVHKTIQRAKNRLAKILEGQEVKNV